jgi:hypothetical protein
VGTKNPFISNPSSAKLRALQKPYSSLFEKGWAGCAAFGSRRGHESVMTLARMIPPEGGRKVWGRKAGGEPLKILLAREIKDCAPGPFSFG